MEHEVFVPVPVERLREALADPARVARAVPGLQQDAGTEPVSGRLKVRVGSHSITYRGTLRITGQDDGSYAIEGDATEARGTGSVKLALTLSLRSAEGGSVLAFGGTASGDGRVTELASDAVASAGARLLSRFAENLAGGFGGPAGAAGVAAASAEPDAGEAKVPGEAVASIEPGAAGEAEGSAEPMAPGEAEGASAGQASAAAKGAGDAESAGEAEAVAGDTDGAAEPEAVAGDAEGAAEPEAVAGDAEGAAEPEAVAGDAEGAAEPEAVAGDAEGAAEPEAVAGDTEGAAEPEAASDPAAQDAAAEPSAGSDSAIAPPEGARDGEALAAEEPSVYETEVPPPPLVPFAEDDFEGGFEDDDEDGEPPAEAAHARRTMIGRSAEEVDHAPPRGRYAPVPAPEAVSGNAALRWAAPAAALVVASAIVLGRVLRRRR
ncbi:SRPBCC domain-containing protein [Streptomyces sp. NBC_00286]|uniref:SRPBCC domain-containing protein n=1 Tax=Streptomyces sp. NBC_00286 TaxID=2975701 RepID=UPI002E2BA691|nr:SRPBCC domain-containing protein [Streptomyces sp. NBC_00286]